MLQRRETVRVLWWWSRWLLPIWVLLGGGGGPRSKKGVKCWVNCVPLR